MYFGGGNRFDSDRIKHCCGYDRCCCRLFHIKTGANCVGIGMIILGLITLWLAGSSLYNATPITPTEKPETAKGQDKESNEPDSQKYWALFWQTVLTGAGQVIFGIVYLVGLYRGFLLCGTYCFIIICAISALMNFYAGVTAYMRGWTPLSTNVDMYCSFAAFSIVLVLYFSTIADYYRRYARFVSGSSTYGAQVNFERQMNAKAGFRE